MRRLITVLTIFFSIGYFSLAFGMYGVVERSLIPFGLHHIWNVPVFFDVGQYVNPETGAVVTGEILLLIVEPGISKSSQCC